MRNLIEKTPWDAAVFGCATFEIRAASPEAMARMRETPGHYTVKVDPIADKRLLHENGFYYCDTLIECYCSRDRLAGTTQPDATLTRATAYAELLPICHAAFVHGRFHRDFAIERARADRRYDEWLRQLHAAGKVRGLLHRGALAGFVAVEANKLVLHAIAPQHRGRGLAKHWWTALCNELFEEGHAEVWSSISVANLAALNLYASLGFRFRNPLDVYHRVIVPGNAVGSRG